MVSGLTDRHTLKGGRGQDMGMIHDPLQVLREICLDLPETEERVSYGEPGWFIRRGPQFVSYPERFIDDGDFQFWCAVPEGSQRILIDADSVKFFVPPHRGRLMWLGVYPGREPDWSEVEELVIDAYLSVAPHRLVNLLENRYQ